MADAADRPLTGGGEFTPAPPGGSPPRREPMHGFVTALPTESSEQPYRPLSLAAVVSFVIALFYAVFVLSMALFTYFSGDILFLPGWTILFPLTAIVISWIGRQAILNSEGTLGGTKLANWGLGLTVVFGLGYWSYHAATYIALRQQAAAFVETKFIANLAKGHVEEAFLLVFKPPRPSLSNNLRGFVESNLNAPTSIKLPGRFTQFSESEYVRLLELGGDKVQYELKSASSPFVDKGVMQVMLTYHVVTPAKTFDMQVVTIANEGAKDAPGRQWQIFAERTGAVGSTLAWNDNEDARLIQKNEPSARQFITNWIGTIASSLDLPRAYLDTLPPARRGALRQKIGVKSEADLAKAAEKDPELREFLKGLNEFHAGNLVKAERGKFWADERDRNEIITEVKKKFRTRDAAANWMSLVGTIPAWEQDGKKLRFSYDVNLFLLPKYIGGARLIIESDEDALANPTPDSWRLVSMEMVRGQLAPAQEPLSSVK